jgi:WhiB family transcriptional regulator, redox-sensing transcriptional regulator
MSTFTEPFQDLLERPEIPIVGELELEWREQAACKGRVELFFGPRAERPQARARREANARRVCADCPVVAECRQWARQNHEFGFWGGESEDQRHFLGFHVSAPIGVRARLRRLEAEAANYGTSPSDFTDAQAS